MSISTVIDRLKNDLHVPIALVVLTITSIFHFKTKIDLGPQYTNSLYAFYAFLGGHGFTQAKWGGSNGDANDNAADKAGATGGDGSKG